MKKMVYWQFTPKYVKLLTSNFRIRLVINYFKSSVPRNMISALYYDVTHRIVAIPYLRRLSLNVGKKLPLHAA